MFLLVYTVARLCASPRGMTWSTRPFSFRWEGGGLATRCTLSVYGQLSVQRALQQDYCACLKVWHLARDLKSNVVLNVVFTCKLLLLSSMQNLQISLLQRLCVWVILVCQTFFAKSVMATPSGCSLLLSAKPTMAVNSWWGHTLSATKSITWVTSGLP